jgi:hypothetical protein
MRFRNAIRLIVSELDADPNRTHAIQDFHKKYGIKQRRLYDVVNVFTAIGCASREGFDQLVWHGRSRIIEELRRAKESCGIDDSSISLSSLFPADNCVGLAPLTTSFLLLFGAMRVDILDLRKVSLFFSRGTVRYKTTLCKLYQIALILGAMDITGRTENVCEVRISEPFSTFLHEGKDANPMAIGNLLSRRTRNDDFVTTRRNEYQIFTLPHFVDL